MRTTFAMLLFSLSATICLGQEKVDEKWVDNSLTFKVLSESIKKDGNIMICIVDTERDICIENLQTGFEIKVYSSGGEVLWEGIGSGRMRKVQLPKALPQASYITLKAFKAHVTNKRTGTLIHQDKPMEIKYSL